jgi:ATP-dependent 26S proteasome regulatory subunit
VYLLFFLPWLDMSSSQILSEGSERTLESPEDLLITRLAKLDLNQSTSEQDIPSVPLPGLEKVYESLVELLLYPLRYPNHFARLNIEAPKGWHY